MARPLDTSVDAHRRQIVAFRAMSPTERLRIAAEMSAEMRALAAAGIRSRRPGATLEEVDDALAELLLGASLAAAARRARLSGVR